ncbi:hypothetical protein [Nibrella viscosa]|uniref:hypothetical protein n=1 Tax=Nibrella viscosa TaxID=1084524 RepID=UPI0031E93B64
MKKLLMPAVMGVLFLVGLTSMISTPPPPPYDCESDCSVFVGWGLFPTEGACMSACRTCTNPASNNDKSATYAVCMCKIAGPFYNIENGGQKNFGQCVEMIKKN